MRSEFDKLRSDFRRICGDVVGLYCTWNFGLIPGLKERKMYYMKTTTINY